MRFPLAVLALVVAGVVALPAFAGPRGGGKTDPKAAARALAERGHALFEARKYAEAIEALTQADEQFHAPTIVLELARVHVAAGKLLEARELLKKIVDERLPPSSPPPFKEAQRTAKRELAALEPRIPSLRIVVRGASGQALTASVDGVEIAAWAPDRSIPVNPGARRVTVRRVGGAEVSRTADVTPSASVVVEIDLPAEGPGLPADPQSSVARRPWLPPALASLGLAAVGVGVGIGTGVATLKSASDLKARCGDVCPPTTENKSDVAAASGLGIASTVGFVVAGVSAAVGVVLFVVQPGGKAVREARLEVGPGSLAVAGVFQ